MMEALYYEIAIVGLVLFVPFIFANWLTKGMLIKLMKVVASRGTKLLVEVIHPIQNYYTIGEVKEGALFCKDKATKLSREVKQKRINVNPDDVFRSWGVNCLRYDETGNRIVKPNFNTVTGFDAIKQENLLIRALYDPKTSLQQRYQLFILIGVGLLILMGGFLVYNQGLMADQVLEITKNVALLTVGIPVV